jgi:lipopolysaccharide/colanic/teichoic acid biosynthesis glycosyltransferase
MKLDINPSRVLSKLYWMARRVRQARILSDLRSAGELQAVIERERAIIDRHGSVFSLLGFDVGNTTLQDVSIQHLVRILRCRVRSTDEVGWLDGQRIGVVLPYTSSHAARKLANDVCKLVASSAPPPTYTVYSYPSQWPLQEDRNEGQRAIAVNSPEWQEEMLQNPSSFSKSIACGCTVSAVQPTTVKIHNCGQPVKRLEALSARPLPAWKRAMDIVGALSGLFLLSPLLLLVAVLIKIASPGPVIFGQVRVGYLGKPFKLWKFRTMKLGANTSVHQHFSGNLINSDRPMTKLDMNDDPRIIPFGSILRVLSLDELPQMVNVLRGDMSLVGPRPCLPYEAQQYLLWQTRRLDAIPGLTGLWQVSGKNRTTFKEMIRLDTIYARKISFWLDVKILLKTLPAIMLQFSDFLSVKRGRDHNNAKCNTKGI